MTLIDIVNRDDTPTGHQATKQEAHEQGLVHRCVAVYVFDEQGRLYVQVHKAGGGLLDHSVGGHVDAGEDYVTAAYRETAEELGIEGVELTEIATGFYSDEGSRIHVFGIYECQPGAGWKFTPNDEVEEIIPETLEGVIAKMEQTPELFTGGMINTMREYRRIKGL
jgi:isopentenyldiphosphate isomerase